MENSNVKNAGPINFRTLEPDDIPFAMKLKSAAGWNQITNDWEFLIKTGGTGNFLATYNGEKAGTATTLTYQKRFSWIGMVLVDLNCRGNGIGSALLDRSINFAEKKGAVRLDATPQGRKLYENLGFITERDLLRLELEDLKIIPIPGQKCRMMLKYDMDKLVKKDAFIFGANRGAVLNYLYQNSPDYALISEKSSGEMAGYCFGRSGSKFEQIGPIVAETIKEARDLLLSAIANCSGKKIIVDVFSDKREWLSFLEMIGFQVQRPFCRMYRGQLNYPGNPEMQYAVAGPEFG